MKLLPHEVPGYVPPNGEQSPKAKKQPKPLPKIGQGNARIDWQHFAPLVHGKTPADACRIVGCSLSAVQNARDKGWIHLVSSEPRRIPWDSYRELAKTHTTYQLAQKTGIHVRSIQRAVSAGLIDCKPGQPNGFTK
jgi:hypothetical protein